MIGDDGAMRLAGEVFMAVPEVEVYRWISRVGDAAGAALSAVRHSPVLPHWSPLPVRWMKGMSKRPTCDFPIFHPVVRAISRRAISAVGPLIADSAELLPLDGLEGEFFGLHCVHWARGAFSAESATAPSGIHATNYVPTLVQSECPRRDFFGVWELVTKVFVSADFVEVYRQHQLTGLAFLPVPIGEK